MQQRSSSISKGRNKFSQNNNDQRLSQARKTSKMQKTSRSNTKSIKRLKQCSQNCKKHDFELKPIGYSNFLSKGLTQSTWVNFCIKPNSTTNTRTMPIPIIPKQFQTEPQIPLFILHQQIYRYQHYLEAHRQQFQEAITKAHKATDNTKQQDIYVAIPKNKNCQICRIKIQNQQEYQRHVTSDQHQINLKRSLGQKYIQQETQAYQVNCRFQGQIQRKQVELRQLSKILKQAKKAIKNLLRKK